MDDVKRERRYRLVNQIDNQICVQNNQIDNQIIVQKDNQIVV